MVKRMQRQREAQKASGEHPGEPEQLAANIKLKRFIRSDGQLFKRETEENSVLRPGDLIGRWMYEGEDGTLLRSNPRTGRRVLQSFLVLDVYIGGWNGKQVRIEHLNSFTGEVAKCLLVNFPHAAGWRKVIFE